MANRALRSFSQSKFFSWRFFASCEARCQRVSTRARHGGANHPGGNARRLLYRPALLQIPQYKFWGYVRRPGQPWSAAKLVVFNEKEKLAPDREQLDFGFDNNYEYKLYGRFSGDTVYDAGSNGFYPEFILKKYELVSVRPVPIFKSQFSDRARAATSRTTIEKPE